MYFYKKQGKQMLDLSGDLIITHNNGLVIGRVKSAAPAGVKNAKYILLVTLGFYGKIKATYHAIKFIWSNITPIEDVEGL
jgi:hypothetical protein